MSSDDKKGEWAETADEGIVPDELSGSTTPISSAARPSRTSRRPRTASTSARGDHADATTQGGQNRPEDEEPDLRDAAAGPRQVDIDSAS